MLGQVDSQLGAKDVPPARDCTSRHLRRVAGSVSSSRRRGPTQELDSGWSLPRWIGTGMTRRDAGRYVPWMITEAVREHYAVRRG